MLDSADHYTTHDPTAGRQYVMQRYLIQLPHDSDPWACAKVVRVFLGTGSHYLAQADWGCSDGDHTAWMIVEAGSREEARQIVPPPFRAEARVVLLNRFTLGEIEATMLEHNMSTLS